MLSKYFTNCRGLGLTVYGYAFESIAIEFGIESAKDFGPALNLLKRELDTYHHNGDASSFDSDFSI